MTEKMETLLATIEKCRKETQSIPWDPTGMEIYENFLFIEQEAARSICQHIEEKQDKGESADVEKLRQRIVELGYGWMLR